jgi:hypothetical protein
VAAVESVPDVVLYVPGVLLGVVEAGEGGGAEGEGGYVTLSLFFLCVSWGRG